MINKKILVTGAAGFIGSHLVEHLIADGVDPKDLRLFVLKGESLKNLPKHKFEIIKGDIRDIKTIAKAVKNVDVIYHLAAMTREGEGKYLNVNWNGTKNLIESAKSNKLKKFVFFSSIAVYGLPAFSGNRTNINEKSKKKIMGEYAKSKDLAEKELLKISEKYNIPYVILRPTTVYGPRDKAGIFQLYKAIKGHYFFMIGRGTNKMDYVYVKDLVRGARLAELAKHKTGDYILGSGKPVMFKEIVRAVADSIDVSLPRINIPKKIGMLGGYVVERINKVFGFSLPFSSDRVKVMTADYYFNSTKAMREIGYAPSTTFKEGATLTAEWFSKKV